MKKLVYSHHKNRELHPKGLKHKVVTVKQGEALPLDGVVMDEANAMQFINQSPGWFKIVDDKPTKERKES